MNIPTLTSYVDNLMERLSFPDDARTALSTALVRITNDEVSCGVLSAVLAEYDTDLSCDYTRMMSDLQTACEPLNIRPYLADMLLLLCMAPRLQQRYAERGIDDAIFYDSLMDLRYKLDECKLVKGEIGTFAAGWQMLFFRMICFKLGRLQYELRTLGADCTVDGVALSKDTPALSIHIPRTGTRMDHPSVLHSYRQAAEFFADEFADKPLVMFCNSWMLYPWHKEVLPPTANMMAFYNDFTIVSQNETTDYSSVWRLFDCTYEGDPDRLPQDSSLRRAYVDRMKAGKPIGGGYGVFIYKK